MVSRFRMVIDTDGMLAPEVSDRVPVTVALSPWAKAWKGSRDSNSKVRVSRISGLDGNTIMLGIC